MYTRRAGEGHMVKRAERVWGGGLDEATPTPGLLHAGVSAIQQVAGHHGFPRCDN